MRYLLAMAWRNTQRNRRRSLLAVSSVALALLFLVFLQGFIGGFLESLVRNITRNETGHIRITTQEFQEKAQFFPVTENLDNPQGIIASISNDISITQHIEMMTPRISFGVLLNNDGNNKSALALAGIPENEQVLTRLSKSILPGGRYLENSKEIIIGSELAKTLKYKLGDQVKVMTQGSDYALHLKKFTIVGIFQTGLNIIDKKLFQIRLDDGQKLLRADNSVQQIIIMLKNYKQAETMAEIISKKLNDPNVAVAPWSAISNNYEYISMVSRFIDWVYFFIATLGVFIIGNIMTMVVLERRHEIGILKSMGIPRRNILFLFLSEGMILGFIGSLVGTALALVIISVININGFDFTSMTQSVEGFPMDNVIFLSINIKSIVKSIFIGTLVSALVSLLPSKRAATMNVVDSLKSV